MHQSADGQKSGANDSWLEASPTVCIHQIALPCINNPKTCGSGILSRYEMWEWRSAAICESRQRREVDPTNPLIFIKEM